MTTKKSIIIASLALSTTLFAQTKTTTAPAAAKPVSKLEQDKASIKSMCGVYKVTFDFAETFAPDTAYKYHKRYREHAVEYVFIAEETPNKIALQHLLVVQDSIVIKHWRQDWVFENKDVYNFYKDNQWNKTTLTAAQAKGTWTQKVYQVDDSPRYEGYGTWVHVDGKHYWESTADAPLPRREFTKRDDYNVLRRHNRMEIFNDGWVLEQDNEKIIRSESGDKLLCWEKGVERFTKGDYNVELAVKWWEQQKQYWADVRTIWNDVYAKTPSLKLANRVDDKRLYESLFELGDKLTEGKYQEATAKQEIKKVIEAFVKA